jgi:glycosyltransferase involved in cell wall biosynthesis
MSSVHVIIPCYKYGHFLDECVQTVLQQEAVETRVLIIDDASPDDTPVVASRLARADRRVEYRRHPVNRGHHPTYNEGLAWASGDYTLLLSADDALMPGALKRAVGLMEARREVGFVYGGAVRAASLPPRSRATTPYDTRVVSGFEFIRSVCQSGLNPVATPTAITRGPLQRQLGGYRDELPHSGDLEMWLRFAVHGAVGYIDAPQALYRQHDVNMHIPYEASIRYLEQRRAAFDLLFANYGGAIPNGGALYDGVRRLIATETFWHACHAFDRGDVALCRHALAFAVDSHRSIRSLPSWKRLAVKRLVGHRVWTAVEPSIMRLRA